MLPVGYVGAVSTVTPECGGLPRFFWPLEVVHGLACSEHDLLHDLYRLYRDRRRPRACPHWVSQSSELVWKGFATIGMVFVGAALTLSLSKTIEGKLRVRSRKESDA